MRTLLIPLVFIGIFAGCAYFEHHELALDAESERQANLRELQADFNGIEEVYYATPF